MVHCGGYSILWGLVLEPLAHPKPGGVTRCKSHPDKDVYDFVMGVYPALKACMAACSGECRGFIGRGLNSYIKSVTRVSKTNIQLGSVLLLLPLCRALHDSSTPGDLFSNASKLVVACDSFESGKAYYDALSLLGASHLGRYEGAVPSVGSGEYPPGLVPALEASRWDHVHNELLSGYPLTAEAYKIMLDRIDDGIEEAILAAILELLASHGDTLIARKWGMSAYLKALREARYAKELSLRHGVRASLEYLDNLWRRRGWNPGAVLDIVGVASGIVYSVLIGELVEG